MQATSVLALTEATMKAVMGVGVDRAAMKAILIVECAERP
jgi:hypothetical protein